MTMTTGIHTNTVMPMGMPMGIITTIMNLTMAASSDRTALEPLLRQIHIG
jgi:hypothetical protein